MWHSNCPRVEDRFVPGLPGSFPCHPNPYLPRPVRRSSVGMEIGDDGIDTSDVIVDLNWHRD